MPSKPLRFWFSVILALVLLGVVAIPIAVAREKIDSSNPETRDGILEDNYNKLE